MKLTPKYNLKKPDLTDYVNIGDINDNMQVIDEVLELKTSTKTSNTEPVELITGDQWHKEY